MTKDNGRDIIASGQACEGLERRRDYAGDLRRVGRWDNKIPW